MSNLQSRGSSNPKAVKREENTSAAERSGEHRLDQTEDGGGEQEQDGDPAMAVQNPANAASTKKVFGIKRSNPTAKKGNDPYNYEEKYPEDPRYEEATPNARVWRTYEDESRSHDANMVEESRDNVDVLLVFAGLFSAVVTTFIAQTYQNLQPDYAAVSASLLYESVLVQRAIANGSTVDAISPSPLNPSITFVPATTDIWVNGLWFTSLFLSLTTALVAVLVKQWLHHYVALPSGTPRDRSFTRQFRYAGFQKWHVQVIIGLLPVLMHLALAIFLSGLVVFLRPLWEALSWIICAGTGLVYIAYMVATILPILFPQCPYRTPLCDLVYASFCRIVPQITWSDEQDTKDRQGRSSHMFRYLPRVQARNIQSLTMIESQSVQQMSINLAAEALNWLFSVSSNPTVQSIVIQSIGGLPMSSEEKFRSLQGDSRAMNTLQAVQHSLLKHSLQTKDTNNCEPVPGMELKIERLLRFDPRSFGWTFPAVALDIDSFELTTALLYNDYSVDRNGVYVSPGTFLINVISPAHTLKLPPRCWFHLVKRIGPSVFRPPVDPDTDDPANMFPLHLSSAILCSFDASRKGIIQDFNSPLVLRFKDALPYFVDKFYDDILLMFSKFVKDPSLGEPSLSQSVRVFAMAIEFLLHRLSLPQSDMSHTTICQLLTTAVGSIPGQTFSSQESTAIMTVLSDILVPRDASYIVTSWQSLCQNTIRIYPYLTVLSPSLHGLRSMFDFMTTNWDHTLSYSYQSDTACWVLTDLLTKCIPGAFTAFLEKRCLEFLGNNTFHEASVAMVREYIAGILDMKHGLDGATDALLATLQLHIDYLHDSHNIFTACSILATHGIENIDRTVIHRDITALVQLRPQDAAWDECRRKLHDLVQNDGADFFSEQRVWLGGILRSLRTDEIDVEKENIRYAMHILDGFFDSRAHTTAASHSLPVRHTTGRLDRFLGWCRGRTPESTPEQVQQV
ncbi:uncharacterized protein EV420DRAFT_1748062 [Desarmillaria tabescens]|uniref:DUF6535 domain-containing protein n=1 Tax=Armillaria tabescens TaxID=1929756 RepID=A0AA39KGV1_ARMTA|nr:uncharacterized protein EV420DRAFT_1748062 [Desarmillaria tabescens]KAK0458578.1 hypothetical protein EV420DRAFT_1748062 [Desarmillaria tabescens]